MHLSFSSLNLKILYSLTFFIHDLCTPYLISHHNYFTKSVQTPGALVDAYDSNIQFLLVHQVASSLGILHGHDSDFCSSHSQLLSSKSLYLSVLV